MKTLLEALAERPLLGDGAMGTQLQAAGLEPGGCGERWNLEHPDRLLEIQRKYVEAGSDILLTNTFCGSRIALARHGLAEQTVAINRAAARIARQAFGGKPGYVLGDIGPFGGLMEPLGDTPAEEVEGAFREQAAALAEAGVDGIIIETQTSLDELGLAIEAARAAGAACIIGSFAFDVTHDGKNARTMMGVDPEKAARFLESAGAHVAALNCGTGVGMAWAARILSRYRAVCNLPLMAQPNAGSPMLEDGRVVYKETPEEMAAGVPKLLEAGARVIGACCGSTPEHIRRLREILGRTES
ncbi:MAG: homocysteine S-methyltransferase family protein [Bryobacterales bacterium]|nr:homocysteine S-methyltransferase family protein [Bryobacterales bacterium]